MLKLRGKPLGALSHRRQRAGHRLAARAVLPAAGAVVAGRRRRAVRHRRRQAPVRRPRPESVQSGDGRLCRADRFLPGADDAVAAGRTLHAGFADQLSADLRLQAAAPRRDDVATPLDALKTGAQARSRQHHGRRHHQRRRQPSATSPARAGNGSASPTCSAASGCWQRRIISWHMPLGFIAGIAAADRRASGCWSTRRASPPRCSICSRGGAMLGAFFIATDPVSGCTTPRGKLIFGLAAGAARLHHPHLRRLSRTASPSPCC